MFPGYTAETALNEPAVRFLALLDHGMRTEYEKQLLAIEASAFSSLKKDSDRKQIINQYKYAIKDPWDSVTESNLSSKMGIERLKKIFGDRTRRH